MMYLYYRGSSCIPMQYEYSVAQKASPRQLRWNGLLYVYPVYSLVSL